MDELEDVRKEISSVDEKIIEALSRRRKLADRVLQVKDRTGAPIRDALREEQLLSELISRGRKQGLDAHFVTRVFHEIIDDSIRLQERRFETDCFPGHRRSLRRTGGQKVLRSLHGAYALLRSGNLRTGYCVR